VNASLLAGGPAGLGFAVFAAAGVLGAVMITFVRRQPALAASRSVGAALPGQ
jgi:hypothetical protein